MIQILKQVLLVILLFFISACGDEPATQEMKKTILSKPAGLERKIENIEQLTKQRSLESSFEKKLVAISSTFGSGDRLNHLASTMSMLRLINTTSIRALLPSLPSVQQAISANGIDPYLAVVIELAHRLGRNSHPVMQRQFRNLALIGLEYRNKNKVKKTFSVLIRDVSGNRYQQNGSGMGRAIAKLSLSSFGHRQFQNGQRPADLVRSLSMLWQCTDHEVNEADLTEAETKKCHQYMDIIRDNLEKSGRPDILPEVMNDVGVGTTVSAFDCLEDEFGDMIDEVETVAACMAEEGSNPGQWSMNGSSLSSTTSNWGRDAPELDGHRYTGSTEYHRSGPNGNTGTQVDHHFEEIGGNGTATVSTYSTIVDGEENSGTATHTNDGQGNQTSSNADVNGNVNYEFDENSDGSTRHYQVNNDGSSTEVVTDSETGVSTIENKDSEGNVTSSAVVNEDGSCEGSACSAGGSSDSTTMPSGEDGWVSNCQPQFIDPKIQQGGLAGDPLGPWIYPAPDSGEVDPELSCLLETINSTNNTPKQCPPSVALCLEPPPVGECNCGNIANIDPQIPRHVGQCNQIQCADGASCNPSTGTCGGINDGNDLGLISPGTLPTPPLPIADILR